MKKLAAFFLLSCLLAGCGTTLWTSPGQEMQQRRSEVLASKEAYTKCLEQNPSEPKKCEGYKKAYEANVKAYKAYEANMRQFMTSGNLFIFPPFAP